MASSTQPQHGGRDVDEPLQLIGQNEAMFNPDAPPLDGTIYDRPAFTYVEVKLREGQRVMADGESMIWMDAKLSEGMETECGDCVPACKRSCAGESVCKNYYTGPGNITFGFKLPGDMLAFAVTPGQGWVINSGSFVCGTDNLTIDARWAGCRACLPCCGNESAFLTRVTVEEGAGVFYAGGYGALNRTEVEAGKRLLMDGGTFFAANQHARFTVAMPGGCKGCLCGGEGFCIVLEGPAVVYTQNRDPSVWRPLLGPRDVKKSGANSNPAA